MRTISQYDAERYKHELTVLREEMTEILLEMERRHSTDSAEAFSRWWDEEGAFSVIEPEEHPKMRGNDPFARRNYGASYADDDQGAT